MLDENRYRTVEQQLWAHFGLEPKERRIHIAGIGVRVQVVGDGPPVVLLHGSPGAGSSWVPLVAHLRSFRCFIVDRPGTGLSDPFVLSGALHVFSRSFVTDLLNALELDRTHLLGSSFGGFLALMAAAFAPQRVCRMVQLGCPAFVPGFTAPWFIRAMTLPTVRWLVSALPANEQVMARMLRQIGHGASLDAGRIPRIFLQWQLALQRHTDTLRNDGEMIGRAGSLLGFPRELTVPDTVLAAVSTATLFLWGEEDPFGSVEAARRTVALMPNASLRMRAASGHLPWLDDPEGIGRECAAFLAADDA